jgi:stage IV sporulation protein FB
MSFWVKGVRVYLSFWFFFGAVLLLWGDRSGFFPIFLGAAAAHEGGHLLYMIWAGMPLGEVRLTPLGLGLVLREDCHLTRGQDLLLNLAGCGGNLAAAVLAAMLRSGMGALRFSAVNAALGLANLLPVRGLDGAQALEDLLVLFLGWEKGCRLHRRIMTGSSMMGAAACLFLLLRNGFHLSVFCLFGIFLWGLLPSKVE